jgi:VIT1/CCC1 family predicted Fe2+/Mn2+ transporter
MAKRRDRELLVRNVVFGISDSLVSTVGLLSGIDVSGTTRHAIIVTGLVYAFVESFSMAVGSYLSEASAEEYESKDENTARPLVGGTIMFASFIVASLVPILPYLFLELTQALWASIFVSVIALFVVGYVNAKNAKRRVVRHAVRMALLGGIAILVGVIVGRLVKA